jgi:Ca-activated chloride channel homolog
LFRFAHIYYFYLLALIPLYIGVLVLFLLWKKKTLSKYGDWAVIRQLMPEYSLGKHILKFAGMAVALACLVFALADPQTGSRLEKVKRKGIDLMICLDVSNSMMAQDIKPNRLERAKQSIVRLIDNLEGDRIGIIVFAGKAYTQLPITTDYAAAKMFTSTINTGIVATQGTAISEAIEVAANGFGESKHNKAIVVITDGEDHEGSVLEQAEAALKKGITIYTIGMGLPEGAPIPVFSGNIQTGYKKDREGQTIMSKLDETLLQRIASIGKGMYVRATTSETGLNKIFDDISKIQKSEIEEKQFSDYEDRFQYFVALALLILITDLFVFERKTQWLKKFRPFEKGSEQMKSEK